MNYNVLGRAGLKISISGFGCGNMGGFLVRGDRKTILKVLARAIEDIHIKSCWKRKA